MSKKNKGKSNGGYCDPPEHSQFKKGQSGNPGGRPKKDKCSRTDVVRVLEEPIAVTKSGVACEMTPFEASLRKLGSLALVGKNLDAALELDQVFENYEINAPAPKQSPNCGVVTVPKDWDWDEWIQMFKKHGRPPWPGKRSGLPKK